MAEAVAAAECGIFSGEAMNADERGFLEAPEDMSREHGNIGLIKMMKEDARAVVARDPSVSSVYEVVFFAVGLRAVWAYRRQHWLWTHGMHSLAMWSQSHTRKRYAIDIHPAATIGRRFVIDHGIGIVIGSTAILGDDCMLYQGVTLGMTGHHAGKRHPTLGNNVMVGARATVLGAITIGDNVKVGANAVVLEDVPANVTVAGIPAHIVKDHRCWEMPQFSLVDGEAAVKSLLGEEKGNTLDDDENKRWSCAL